MAKESASKVLPIGEHEVQITNPEKLYFSSQQQYDFFHAGIPHIHWRGIDSDARQKSDLLDASPVENKTTFKRMTVAIKAPW